jgi:adenosine kinase
MTSQTKGKTVAPGTLLGFGNPLLDISTEVTQAFYDKYSLEPASACLHEEKHSGIFKDMVDNCKDVGFIAGGATQNSCRIAQTLLGEQSKGACRFVGGVGKDEYSEKLTTACKDAGMEPFYHVDEETPTGTCAVAILDNERTLVANLAAANTFKKAHIAKPEIAKIIDEATFYYASSFFLTVPEGPATLLEVAKHVASNPTRNKKFIMNLGAPFLMQFFQDKFQAALQYCDIVFGNETEAEAYAKAVALDCAPTDLAAIGKAISKAPKATPGQRISIITHGAEPTVVCIGDEVQTFPVPKLAKEKMVDTNGAGDSFVGGFLSQYMRGGNMAISIAAGSAAARNCIQQSGAQLGPCEETVFDQVLIQAAHDGVEIDEVSVAFTLGFHAGTAKKLETSS